MIAEKIERQLNYLNTLLIRNNGDLAGLAPIAISNIRAEVERLKVLEEEAFTRHLTATINENMEGDSHVAA